MSVSPLSTTWQLPNLADNACSASTRRHLGGGRHSRAASPGWGVITRSISPAQHRHRASRVRWHRRPSARTTRATYRRWCFKSSGSRSEAMPGPTSSVVIDLMVISPARAAAPSHFELRGDRHEHVLRRQQRDEAWLRARGTARRVQRRRESQGCRP